MERQPTKEDNYPKIGIYEHYKSTPEDRRYYQILGFARHTETNEILTIYIPLYLTENTPGLRLQARPLEMFTEIININGEEIPRFRYIGHEI